MEETLTTGLETQVQDNNTENNSMENMTMEQMSQQVPQGIDEALWDKEKGSLNQDAVLERLSAKDKEIENYKKQALDMRRKISKGIETPESAEKYAELYTADEKYDTILNDKESNAGKYINQSMANIDKLAFDNGMTKEQANAVKNAFLQVMEEVSIIDTRTDEQKATDKAQYIKEQKAMLGDKAEEIIKDNVEFCQNYGVFDNEEKKFLLESVGKSAVANKVVAKIRELFGEKVSSIPSVSADNLPSDIELAKEYNNPATTDARRMEIIQQRINAGRTDMLPVV